jgi:hypothetical protein
MKRKILFVGLSLLLPVLPGCVSEDPPSLYEAAMIASDDAAALVDRVVGEPERAARARKAVREVKLITAQYYANTFTLRDELFRLSGDPDTPEAKMRGVVRSLDRLRRETRVRLVDQWLLARAWMTGEEWTEFNQRRTGGLDLEAN